jgi:hypothetical protein
MADTWKRLAGPAQLTAAAATKYTVPSTTKTFVRQLHFYNADTVSRTVTWSIGADAAGTRLLDSYPIPAATPYDVYLQQGVMEAAEILQALADVTLKVTLTIFGFEQTLG